MEILIVDDHAVVREGLKRMLEASEPSWRIAEAADAGEALGLLRTQPFDIAVLDISMPGLSGLDLLGRIRALRPETRVLMLSMYVEEHYAMRALRSGACGYVTKDSAPRELVAAIRKVLDGGSYVSQSLAQAMVVGLCRPAPVEPHQQLSNRELDIFRRLAVGERPTEIARALHISVKTVSSHKARVLFRLGLPNTAALVRYAMEHRMLTEGAQVAERVGDAAAS